MNPERLHPPPRSAALVALAALAWAGSGAATPRSSPSGRFLADALPPPGGGYPRLEVRTRGDALLSLADGLTPGRAAALAEGFAAALRWHPSRDRLALELHHRGAWIVAWDVPARRVLAWREGYAPRLGPGDTWTFLAPDGRRCRAPFDAGPEAATCGPGAPAPRPRAVAGRFLLRGVRLLGLAGEGAMERADVRLAGGLVEEVAPRLAPREGERVLELGGTTLLPGLWDAHVHRVPGCGPAFLAAGVTTVVDMGGPRPLARDLRGPRVLSAGHPLEGPEPVWPEASAPASPAALRRRSLARALARGDALVKVYGTFPPHELEALERWALSRGLRVAADLAAPLGEVLSRAPGVILAHAPDPQGGVRAMARRLAASGRVVVSTLRAFREAGRLPGRHPVMDPWWGDGGGVGGFDPAAHEALRRRGARMERFLEAYAAAGAPGLLAGTDTGPATPGLVPGVGLVEELVALAELGLSRREVLRAATVRPARVFGDPRRGHLRPGAVADLLVVDGDPTRALTALHQVRLVFLAGRVAF